MIRTKPEVPTVDELVDHLNNTNDLNAFLRGVRKAFRLVAEMETDAL